MTTFEEQYAALFGTGSSDRQYIKYGSSGEGFQYIQTGPLKQVPQTMPNGDKKFMVKENGKWSAKAEGSFSEGLENFEPRKDIEIPVKVVGHILKGGKKDEDFEPFETMWELRAGNREEKFKEAMLEAEVAAVEGTKYFEKLLDNSTKPFKYTIKIVVPKAAE